jgi:hypothetical protein
MAAGMAEMAGLATPTSWYTWRLRNWGTKWDLDSDVEIAINDADAARNILRLRFDAANSPPEAAFCAIAAKFPTLTFVGAYVEEDNMVFGGYAFQGVRQAVHVDGVPGDKFYEAEPKDGDDVRNLDYGAYMASVIANLRAEIAG